MFLRNFLRSLMLAVCAGALSLARAQVSFPLEGPNAQFHQLFERVFRSEFVTQGKVVERKMVWKRGVPRAVQVGPDQYRSSKVEEVTGGYVVAVEVSGALCKQQDFLAPAKRRQDIPSRLYVFVPYSSERESDLYPSMHTAPELLFAGREYLLFIAPWPQQSELQAKFELDPNVTYYRVFDGYLGARELPDPASRGTAADRTAPLISALTALCGAVTPEDVEQKLARLRTLQNLAEPRWKDSVDAAIRAIQAQQRPPRQ